ncbi:hypothetical protein CDL15_Pgr020772 [Punica granatum]|uniref:Uncharacterized protein n=1 Tax=Punica granatum TaxID=22663 RepID=A0A218XVK1_PUNGR|nr:hypothetical protein CDL15_Pgr020772 [Punica granatum]
MLVDRSPIFPDVVIDSISLTSELGNLSLQSSNDELTVRQLILHGFVAREVWLQLSKVALLTSNLPPHESDAALQLAKLLKENAQGIHWDKAESIRESREGNEEMRRKGEREQSKTEGESA